MPEQDPSTTQGGRVSAPANAPQGVSQDGVVPRVRLNLLLIEDSTDDAALVTRTLTQAGYEISACQVYTEEGLRAALADRSWDLAIADFTMPSFTGISVVSGATR